MGIRSIGVVVTCYQYGKYIDEAASSILALTRRPDAVVIVDDASPDGSAFKCHEAGRRLTEGGIETKVIALTENRGSSGARNAGIAQLDTEWILSLDGDDLLLPHAIEEIEDQAYSGGRRRAEVIQGGREAFEARAHRMNRDPARGVKLYRHFTAAPAGVPPIVAAFLSGASISTANSAFLRELWEISPFDESIRTSEDTAFWVRCSQNGGRFRPSKRALSRVRFHADRKVFDRSRRKKGLRRKDILEIVSTPYPCDFIATERHFIDHLAPVWHALPPRKRGRFLTLTRLRTYAEDLGLRVSAQFNTRAECWRLLKVGRGPVATCAHGDYEQVRKAGRAVIFFEHGAGQPYRGQHTSYAGWNGRKGVILFVMPGPIPAAKTKVHYPTTPILCAGTAKLDPFLPAGTLPAWKPGDGIPTVAISFHWDCRVAAQETRTAFDEFKKALPDLVRLRDEGLINLLGHGHPRAWNKPPGLRKHYEAHGIEIVARFDNVMRRADLYICDNSSTIFEFAATGRPVVLMNPSYYRRGVKHGLRFWECASVGINCDRPGDLARLVLGALMDPPEVKKAREIAVRRVYSFTDGNSASRIASGIEDALDLMYRDPTNTRRKPLRILKATRTLPNKTKGRAMSTQTKEPKTERLFTRNGFVNKHEEGRVRANSYFWTNKRRAGQLVQAKIAEYPSGSTPPDNEANGDSRARPTPGPSVKKPAKPSTKKGGKGAKKPTGSDERLEAAMKQFREEILPTLPADQRAEAETKALAQFERDLAEGGEVDDPPGEVSKETLEAEGGPYKGYHIGAGGKGGWREVREDEGGKPGALIRKVQGLEAATALADSLDEERAASLTEEEG